MYEALHSSVRPLVYSNDIITTLTLHPSLASGAEYLPMEEFFDKIPIISLIVAASGVHVKLPQLPGPSQSFNTILVVSIEYIFSSLSRRLQAPSLPDHPEIFRIACCFFN